MTENDKPVSDLGKNPEEKARKAWEFFVAFLNVQGEMDEKISLENIEIVERPHKIHFKSL